MVTKIYAIEDEKLRLNFHYGQGMAWTSKARIVAVIAGSQAGKTAYGSWWLWREIQRGGAGDYIAATATFDLFKLKMLPEIREVFEEVLGIGRYWKGDKIMEIANPETGQFSAKFSTDKMWARIILRSASSGSGLESSTAKAAWMDEAGMDEFPLSSFDGVERRLTLNQGRILITTTPYNLGWLKQEIIDKDGQNGIEVINFPSSANPAFPKAEFERLQNKLPDWKFNMFMRGLLSRPPGMIYNDFNDLYREEGGHKVHPFDLPADWPRYCGVDPGANNTAKIWLAHDPFNNFWYVYRDMLSGGKSTRQHVQEVQELSAANNEHVVMYYVGQKSETQVRWDWAEAGIQNISGPAVHDVESGIDKIIELFKTHRLFIFDTCRGLLDEIGRYSRKLDALGEPTDEIKDKDTFHRLDALRYGVGGALINTDSNWEARIA